MPTVSDMTGKAVLVTGAASGLGRATALTLARAGANVCIVDRNAEGLAETEQTLGALGVEVLVHATDLSVAARCGEAIAAAHARFGRLDSLCNVAGLHKLANTPEMPVEDWNMVLAVNLSAPFHLIQAAIPHLLQSKGAVVNVSSTAAFFGQAYSAAYCASKAGLLNLTKALAMEYLTQDIRFNAVAPGGMMTGMIAGFSLPTGADPELITRFVPKRGLVEVDDVADMVAFLASPASSGYHGACITLDNGMTAG